MKKLEDYLKYEQPTKYIVDSEKYSNEYDIPVLTAGKSFILGYTNEKNNIFSKEELPVIIFDDFTTDCKYVDFPFKVKSSAMKILHPINNANAKFLYYYMKNIQFDSTLHKRYWISEYSQLSIKELNSKMQDEFANKMQKLEKLIELKNKQLQECNNLIKSQFVEMFEKYENYNIMPLSKCTSFIDYRGHTPKVDEVGSIRMVNAKSVGKGYFKYINEFITEDLYNVWMHRGFAHPGDILFVTEGHTFGNSCLVPDDLIKFALGQRVITIQGNENIINNKYLCSYMQTKNFYNKINMYKTGGTAQGIRSKDLLKIEVPVPPIELQNKFAMIVEQIDKQKFEFEKSLKKLEELQASLMQEYFG